ncbi:MAG: arylsulfatase [Verrucomicrobiaceae bacterium]|nr:arylsulfatase [Verrucomicrobiaceae bacterium]
MRILRLILTCCLLPCPGSMAENPGKSARPSFLFLLVDDLGWADLGCYGSTFHETPHLDRLAREGVRFTDAYTAASICSPTRASIMTGKHPVRVNITDWIPGSSGKGQKLQTPADKHHLPLEEVTIAEALKEGGYSTFYTGKWHLGGKPFSPDKQGFDEYYDPHQDPSKGSPGRGKTTGRKHATTDLTRETKEFIHRNSGRPFFACLSYYDIHTPIIAERKYEAHYKRKAAMLGPSPRPITEHDGRSRPRQDNAALASMVQAVDDSVGDLVQHLGSLGILENTYIFFFSDNGGLCTKRSVGPGCNLPLRASKGWLYEGGIRVPLIVRQPGKKNAGSQPTDCVLSTDIYPTLLALAGLPPRPSQHADGASFESLLTGGKTNTHPRSLYWHYPHYHGSTWTPGAAIRDGDWKLIEFYHYGKVELYNLSEDLGEANDLAAKLPERTRVLRQKLKDWQRDMGARMPLTRP